MRTALAAVVLALAACGGGGGSGSTSGGGPTASSVRTSLWPMSAGSRWTYDIDDPLKGRFQKFVEVVGEEPVPESSARAVRMRDVEASNPPHEETAWLVDADGIVERLREEDRRNDVLVRTTIFAPGGPKALSRAQPAGWSRQVTVTETTIHPDGTTKATPKTYELRVLADRETVQTPAGTFECIKVLRTRIDKADVDKTYWYAPGVGKVKEESIERTETLSSYAVR